MASNSDIEWTDHSFNPWWGCFKVSPGCQHCYADTLAHRYGHHVWGPAATTARRTFGDKHWAEPRRWNAQAEKAGVRRRVFCASMADVFEDHPTAEAERPKLWTLIEETPALDWLLLTKRPENIRRALPDAWLAAPRPNVWLGTSAEDQERADTRIPALLSVPAALYFLSAEPLLGPLDLRNYLGWAPTPEGDSHGIDWVIVGGESGPGARPMDIEWAERIHDDCLMAGVAFFMKQLGSHGRRGKGAKLEDFPAELRQRDFPMYQQGMV